MNEVESNPDNQQLLQPQPQPSTAANSPDMQAKHEHEQKRKMRKRMKHRGARHGTPASISYPKAPNIIQSFDTSSCGVSSSMEPSSVYTQ